MPNMLAIASAVTCGFVLAACGGSGGGGGGGGAPGASASISPSSGPANGGTSVTVTGSGFATGGVSVLFGALPATSLTVTSPTTLTAVVPAGAPGTTSVTLLVNGFSSTIPGGFTYGSNVTIASISPSTLLAGGATTPITITGAGFVPGAAIVTIGGVPATSVTVQNDTTISAVAPARATSGTVDVVVTSAGATATLANGLVYLGGPVVTSLNPPAVHLGSTQSVTITGTFAPGVPATVTFGGAPGSNVVVQSATTITATAPASQSGGGVTVSVTQGVQTGSLANGFTYLVPAQRLSFGTQPTTVAAGATFPRIDVRVEDNTGTLSTAQLTVTLVAVHPGGGTLAGTTSVVAMNGIASFTNLSIAQAGAGITLVASSPGLTSATSASFTVTP